MNATPQQAKATDPICRKCGTELTDENWYPSYRKRNSKICKECDNKRMGLWRKANPEKAKDSDIRSARKLGKRPYNENKECSSFLGVHIAERVLSYVFKDVEKMPYGNHGYDFICNKGKKIDVKSACLTKTRNTTRWIFPIRHNTTADYFICLAFDDRERLKPLHAWLLPGSKFNHLTNTSISQSTIHKWDVYHLDISKVAACCNELRVATRSTNNNTLPSPPQHPRKPHKTPSTDWYLSTVDYLKAGLNPAKIAVKLGIPKQTLQYRLNILKKQGIIRKIGYGCWQVLDQPETVEKKIGTLRHDGKEVPKEVRTPTQTNLHKFTEDSVRAHAFVFVLQIPNDLRNWNNRKREQYLRKNHIQYKHLNIAGEGQRLIVEGRKVWLTDPSVIIYDRASYLAGIARDAKSLAVHTHISIIRKVERILNADFTINGDYRFRVSRQHYALIKNALAKQYDKEGKKLEVRTERGLWMVIDNSYKLHETEFVHPRSSPKDTENVVNFFNGVKTTAITPEFILQAMNGIQENQAAFAVNMTSHVDAIRKLGSGVEQMNSLIGQIKV